MSECIGNCPVRRQIEGDISVDKSQIVQLRAAAVQIETIHALSQAASDEMKENGQKVGFLELVAKNLLTYCNTEIDEALIRTELNRSRLHRLGSAVCRGAYVVEAPDGAEMWMCGRIYSE